MEKGDLKKKKIVISLKLFPGVKATHIDSTNTKLFDKYLFLQCIAYNWVTFF